VLVAAAACWLPAAVLLAAAQSSPIRHRHILGSSCCCIDTMLDHCAMFGGSSTAAVGCVVRSVQYAAGLVSDDR
jgi:hypothetical protein